MAQFNNSILQDPTKMGDPLRSRYSGAVAHAADWYVTVWNAKQMIIASRKFECPDGYDIDHAYALIQKNKDYPLGHVELDWTPLWTRFRDTSVPLGYPVFAIAWKGMPKQKELALERTRAIIKHAREIPDEDDF